MKWHGKVLKRFTSESNNIYLGTLQYADHLGNQYNTAWVKDYITLW